MLAGLLALLLGPQAATPARTEEVAVWRPGTVVRVSVGLVQVDAVVTDKQGRQVSDLTAADFVIKEEGQEREVTQLSYVRLAASPTVAASPAAEPPAAGAEPGPARPIARPPGRMITLVVDDLNVSYEGLSHLRDALHNF